MHTRLAVILAGLLAAGGALADPAASAPAPAKPAAAAPAPAPAPHVYGRVEHAMTQTGPAIDLAAQLSGGGDITVLKVLDIKYAHGEGGMFVHFTIDNGRVVSGRTVNLDLPVLQDQHKRDRTGAVEHRPIVQMTFCIGDHSFTTTVALQNREDYDPPLVLSKADAAQFGTLDPQKKNTMDPSCKGVTAPQ
jgi:hypothetical protein